MSNTSLVLTAQKRESVSKSSLRKLRESGFIPAVVYGNKSSQMVTLSLKGLPKEHTRSTVISIDVDGVSKTVIMREVQVNPLTDKPTHIDFQEITPTDVVKVRVPLQFIGLTREQEKEGSFKTLLRSLEIKAVSSKIPQILPVKVGHLKTDESAHISDVELPEGVTLLAKKNLALASLVKL